MRARKSQLRPLIFQLQWGKIRNRLFVLTPDLGESIFANVAIELHSVPGGITKVNALGHAMIDCSYDLDAMVFERMVTLFQRLEVFDL